MTQGESAERIHPPSPSKREHMIMQGYGPRATWMASLLGILFFAATIAVVAPMWIGSLIQFTRTQFQFSSAQKLSDQFITVITPTLWLVILALVGAVLAHALAHGAWMRIGPWKLRPRSTIIQRISPVFAGIFTAFLTLVSSAAFAWPWIINRSNWSVGTLSSVAWSTLAMIGMTALGAVITLGMACIVQRIQARNRFENSIRLTPAEAKQAARESGEGRNVRRTSRLSSSKSSENQS